MHKNANLLYAGMAETPDNLYKFFLGRVREKMHVILCFSPVGSRFGQRAQQFPGLINGCVLVLWLPVTSLTLKELLCSRPNLHC